jgi:hypothetical protein
MEHGVRHGRGKYTFGASGAVYEGDYASGQRHGRGAMKFPDGSKYEGEPPLHERLDTCTSLSALA